MFLVYNPITGLLATYANRSEIGTGKTIFASEMELAASKDRPTAAEMIKFVNQHSGEKAITEFADRASATKRLWEVAAKKFAADEAGKAKAKGVAATTKPAAKAPAAKPATKPAPAAKPAAKAPAKAPATKPAAKAPAATKGTKAAPAAKPATDGAKGQRGRRSAFEGKTIIANRSINPRRAGTHGFRSYAVLMEAGKKGLAYADYIAKGGRPNDLAWDLERNWVEVK